MRYEVDGGKGRVIMYVVTYGFKKPDTFICGLGVNGVAAWKVCRGTVKTQDGQ
jgi:hypothetical protein